MAKPTDIPTWATDAGATSDPGPTRRATGFIAGKKLPAKWLNWLLNRQAGWFTYLRDLHTEPEFLNKIYTWTERHAFRGISVGLFGLTVVGGADNEIVYGDANGTVKPRERTTYIPLSATAQATATTERGWVIFSGAASSRSTQQDLLIPIQLPTGARLRRVEARVSGALTGTKLHLVARLYEHSDSGLNVQKATQQADLTTSPQILKCEFADEPVNNDTSTWEVIIRAGSVADPLLAGAYGNVQWVRVVWLDPGPRNY